MDPHGSEPVSRMGTPLGLGHAAMILVHGRSAGPENILDLVPRFFRPEVTFLAPAAAGRTWYPQRFLAPTDQNEPGLSSGLAVLAGLVDEAAAYGVPPERQILLGFSQGACLVAEFAVRHPRRYGGVIVYSGGLIGPPGTVWDTPGTFDRTPVFLGCSDTDGHVPWPRVEESAGVFGRMEADVTLRRYPGMGHLVNDEEITFTGDLLDQVLSGAA